MLSSGETLKDGAGARRAMLPRCLAKSGVGGLSCED